MKEHKDTANNLKRPVRSIHEIASDAINMNIELSEICKSLINQLATAEGIIEQYLDFENDLQTKVLFLTEKKQLIKKAQEFLIIREKQRKASRKPRPDKLQKIIISIVEKNPRITESELLNKLEPCIGLGVITDIEENLIYWVRNDGEIEESPLKDRLARARKKVKSR